MDDKRFAVDIIVNDVLWLGYAKVILKSDNEPAIIKLLKETLAALKVSGLEQAGEEHSPPYDSQANGSVENAVKLVKCRLRTLKLCLERRIGKKIPPRHPIMTWLAPHAAAILRYRSRGDDGKTPHERVRLRPFNSRLIGFGERCSYKARSKEPLSDDHKWHHGIFLGICPTTGQYILHCVERKAIKFARTIKCLPDESKWCSDDIEAVRTSPYDNHKSTDPGVVLQDRPDRAGDADQLKKTPTSRKIYIKGEDIRVYGYTVGCAKCDHERRYGPGRTTKGHSDACRARIVGELAKTPEGQRRLQAADDRVNRSIAEHIEEQDQVPPVHGGGVDENVPGPPDGELKFEDLDASEQRVDIDDPAGADEPVGGSPGYPAAADVPNPAVVEEMCREGQELPGMEIDVMQGNPTDVRSLVLPPPESGRSPGVIGCQVDPIAAPVSWTLRPGMNGDVCNGTQ